MGEITKFQQMNGCSACTHAADRDASGKLASSFGAAFTFWCQRLEKAVETKEGASCSTWEYQA